MKRRVLVIAASLAVAGALAVPAFAADVAITIGESCCTFAPDGISNPNDTTVDVDAEQFRWDWGTDGTTSPGHNVRQDRKLFYSGSPTGNNPGGFIVLASAGSYHYYCEPHLSAGMEGRIQVRPIEDLEDDPSGLPFRVRWARTATTTGDRFQVRFRILGGNGSEEWRSWKTSTSKNSDVFGVGGSPVTVKADRFYEFKVRSMTDSDHRSDPSPILQVSTFGI
jgi:hypothetical protein